jgi:predicted Zn-dependent protease
MFLVRLKQSITTAFLGVALLFASQQSLADEFDAEFLRIAQELNNQRIPRPSIKSVYEIQNLIQKIHFSIFDVTKQICKEEKVRDSDCKWSIRVKRDAEFNAYATSSQQIIISSGLVDKTTFEDELAFVVAHEVAHHLLAHVKKKRGVIFSGLLLGELVFGDIPGGILLSSLINQMTSREFESAADRIALRIITLSGYETHKAKYVLMRMAKMETRLTSRFMQSHPSGLERLVAFEKMVAEL